MPPPILIPLDQATLLFLPSPDSGDGTVVQVCIRPAREATVDLLAAFYLAQDEISELILRLIALQPPLSRPVSIEFDAPAYTLRADTKKWEIGQDLKLKWGHATVTPGPYKWVFAFTPKTATEIGQDKGRGRSSI
ncbi:hypothetical protein OE88DRAFT_1811597 [Heliocybe sulcata]|uniref:Uncharacterized protein n=1 Tax=Heliocybe sulcata TaxID=5364 RepID=A0A5C3MMT8_9AGAM|nr:hypothetical protein OE88DRAFT_1811597 [Heliocybe sulcata]